jgi:hypothetical protein
LSITPVDRSGPETSDSAVSTLDPRLKNLTDKLKTLSKKGFFK